MLDPDTYNAWYETHKGRWIGEQEILVLMKLIPHLTGQTLLDIGSGTGYFTRSFNQLGMNVTGFDSSFEMNQYASAISRDINFIQGNGTKLPFADNCFDYCSAITSLCFISDPEKTLAEMWRVSRKGVVLGLLNRHSLLYYMKQNSKGYQGARWDKLKTVRQWSRHLVPEANLKFRSVIWIPSGGLFSRIIEKIAPKYIPYAGFLALVLEKQQD